MGVVDLVLLLLLDVFWMEVVLLVAMLVILDVMGGHIALKEFWFWEKNFYYKVKLKKSFIY